MEFLKKLRAFLQGKKTYIAAALLVILSGLKAEGYITAEVYEVILGFLGALGLASLRAAVARKK